MTAADDVRRLIARHGPLPVDRVVERALYGQAGGFYESGGTAGRRGDFITSPEVGPLFGAVMARALGGWWQGMGRPDPFVVVDAGAGPGTLCRSVLAARPACAAALRYVLVERSAAARRRHRDHLRLEDPALAFAPVDPDTEAPVPEAPRGPIVVSLAAMPRVVGPVVIIANELLDNLPFGVAERRQDRWFEVRVDWSEPVVGPGAATAAADRQAGPDRPAAAGEAFGFAGGRSAAGRFVERLVPLDDERAAWLERLAPDAADRARVPLQDHARRWLREALAVAGPGGRVVAIDYATTTADLAARPQDEWLRTYRGHRRGDPYLESLGAQDVTCEVAVDQLTLVRPPARDRPQAEWLRSWGIAELVDEGRRRWQERAAVGDLAALTARSRATEAEALTDPGGLGRFRVLEWEP